MATISRPYSLEFQPPPPKPHSQNRLCGVCKTIDFGRYLYDEMPRNILLRTWEEIIQSQSCPFCRLVVRSLTVNPSRVPRHPNDQIVLYNNVSWELGIEMLPYDRLQSEAYSNKFDLRSKAKQCSNVAYRFVVSVNDDPEIRGYIQYFSS